jgi:predicted nucleic acid-binding protein
LILVDSDVVIAHLRGHDAAKAWLLEARQGSGPIAASAVSVVEVAGGMRFAERKDVTPLFGLDLAALNVRRFPMFPKLTASFAV